MQSSLFKANLLKNIKNNKNTIRTLNSSPLEYLHKQANATLVDFHGWNLPVKYPTPLLESAQHCRSKCSLFDVSHMLQTKITGENTGKLLNNLTVADVENLPEHSGTLTLFTNEKGGIIDDLIINKLDREDNFYVVSNAARANIDLPHMLKEAKKLGNVDIQVLKNPLIAMQGPKSEEILQKLVTNNVDLSNLYFMDGADVEISGMMCRVTRCGYTGEDGFEISCLNSKVVEEILKIGKEEHENDIAWAGLGERDILRLEGGMCLYGNDINETTSPYSARLLWTVAKNRRTKADFPGAEILLNEIANKTPSNNQFRVGLAKKTKGRAIRAGMDIYNETLDRKIGHVTSGSKAANLDPEKVDSIGQAYIEKGFHQNGKSCYLVPGGKKPSKKNSSEVVITKMPFLKTSYKMK